MLRRFRYETIEMKKAVTKVIDTLTQEDFDKLLERYKCIAAGGDYFEGDKSFMCVLSIKVPIGKSLETYLMILVFALWKKKSPSFSRSWFFLFLAGTSPLAYSPRSRPRFILNWGVRAVILSFFLSFFFFSRAHHSFARQV